MRANKMKEVNSINFQVIGKLDNTNYYVFDNGEVISFDIDDIHDFLERDLPNLEISYRNRIKILVLGYENISKSSKEYMERIKIKKLSNLRELLPNLIKIKANYLWLYEFPILPFGIEQIDLVGNKLDNIPNLSDFVKLESANFNDNNISVFNMDLPDSIRSLSLASNCLTEYDSTIPNDFTNLDVSLNPLENGIGISRGVIDAMVKGNLHINTYQSGINLSKYNIKTNNQNSVNINNIWNATITRENNNDIHKYKLDINTKIQPINNQKITYSNQQTVHHQKIQNDLLKSYQRIKERVKIIMETEGIPKLSKDELSNDIRNKMIISNQKWYHKILPILNNKLTKRQNAYNIIKKCLGDDFYANLHPNFEDNYYNVLHNVWYVIQYDLNEYSEDIYDSLSNEILDGDNYCYHGILSRIINSINGYTDMVQIELNDSEIIGNRIIMIIRKYSLEYENSNSKDKNEENKQKIIDKAKIEVSEILEDFNLTENEKNHWINAIDF
jgi:hypothetical protein